MSKIFLSPTGKLIRGHVLDPARAPFERKLQEYDPQLYLRWNPNKLKGWGLWEVRRRPEFKTVKDIIPYKGNTYTVVDYVENGFECHIIDVPFLNYKLLEKLQRMDTWRQSYKAKDWANDFEYREGQVRQRINNQADADLAYNVKQNKTLIRDMMRYVNEGGNPYKIADVWDKV